MNFHSMFICLLGFFKDRLSFLPLSHSLSVQAICNDFIAIVEFKNKIILHVYGFIDISSNSFKRDVLKNT